jgi:Ca2+-binding EF-hand superfamily protein
MGIFFVAILYVIQSVVMIKTCGYYEKAWNNFDRAPRSQVISAAENAVSHGRITPKSSLLRYRMIRAYFLTKIKGKLPDDLPIEDFSFALYLQKMMVDQTLEQLEINTFTWICALISLGCFYVAFTSHEWLTKNGHWVVDTDDHRRLGGGGGGGAAASMYDANGIPYTESSEGAFWRGEYNTKNTLETSLYVGYAVFLATLGLWYVSRLQVSKILTSSGITIKSSGNRLDLNSLWWIDSCDDGSSSSPSSTKSPTKSALVEGAHAFRKVKNPLSVSTEWFRRGLDLATIFNCYYLSFFFINSMMNAIDSGKYWFVVVAPLPSLLMIFWTMPLVTSNYTILVSCTAFNTKSETFTEVLKMMTEERLLVQQVQEKLKAKDAAFASEDSNDGLFKEIDADGSGSVSHAEFSAALQNIGVPITAKTMWILLRVIDPDASGEITKEELQHFMNYGKSMERGDQDSPGPAGASTPMAASAAEAI